MPNISLRLLVFGTILWLALGVAGCTNNPVEPPAELPNPTPGVTGTTAVPPAAYPPPLFVAATEFAGYPVEPENLASVTPTSVFTETPKPIPTPSNTPTITPTPTPLPLGASDYLAVWADVAPREGPLLEDPDTIFWIADPADIANRQELFRYNEPTILSMSMSPNGRYIAFSTWNNVLYPAPLWLFDMNSHTLEQFIPDSSHLFSWIPDSTAIISVIGQGEGYYQAIEKVDINSNERRILVTTQEIDSHPNLIVLGWSADGERLYYQKGSPGAYYDNDYEVWRLDTSNPENSPIQLLPSGFKPLWSQGVEPETETILLQDGGFTSYYTMGQTSSLVSAAQLEEALAQIPIAGSWRQFTGVWSPTTPELIYSHWDQQADSRGQIIWRHNLLTKTTEEIGLLEKSADWQFLKVSPDQQWLAISNQDHNQLLYGPHILHVPTNKLIPIFSTPGHQYVFLGWVANPKQ